MEMGTAGKEGRATIEGGSKLSRNKIVKIRMSSPELFELDEIGKKLGFAERATVIRWLVGHFDDLELSQRIVAAFESLKQSEKAFEALAIMVEEIHA
ncbi:MAG: hypothetical protein V1787_06050 [Candidatus Micrarchaeota archaeon]